MEALSGSVRVLRDLGRGQSMCVVNAELCGLFLRLSTCFGEDPPSLAESNPKIYPELSVDFGVADLNGPYMVVVLQSCRK